MLEQVQPCPDDPGSVSITVVENDLVSLILLVLPKSWHDYQDSVNGREYLPKWECSWSDLVQEEIRWSTKGGPSSKHDEEENYALARKAKKGKGKKFQSKVDPSQGSKKKDLLKIKCFHCHELGHYATKCPRKKAGKNPSGGAAGEALVSQFELDFTLVACMVTSVMVSVWYLDSGASFHMTSNKEFFNDLEEKDLQKHTEMGDDERYSATNIDIVTFQREYGSPITLKDVMYVSGLKKNLVSCVMLVDHGYDVIFSKGKTFLCHIASGQVKQIGVRVKNLYKLDVEDFAALSTKAEKVQSRNIDELWHRRLGYLHHGALKIMQ